MAVTFTQAGKVATGFSFPYVAKYAANEGVITFSDAMELARGVSVNVSPTTSDANKFYANNQEAESGPNRFTGGTATLTVDGLLVAAERFVMGLPAAGEDGWTAYGDSAQTPYVAIGYIARFMSGGQESFTPTILVKTKLQQINSDYATQEEEIDWKTQELTADLFRGDDLNHSWKYLGADYATETEALAALRTKLGVA
jgi:phi13 family phage major tail protein